MKFNLPNTPLTPALELSGSVFQKCIDPLERVRDAVRALPAALNRLQESWDLDLEILEMETALDVEGSVQRKVELTMIRHVRGKRL